MRSADRSKLHNYSEDAGYRRAVEQTTWMGGYPFGTWVQHFLMQLSIYHLKLLPKPMLRLDLTPYELHHIGMLSPLPPKEEEHLMFSLSYMVWEWDYSYEEPNGPRTNPVEVDCFHPGLSLHYVDPDQGSYSRRDASDHQGSRLCI